MASERFFLAVWPHTTVSLNSLLMLWTNSYTGDTYLNISIWNLPILITCRFSNISSVNLPTCLFRLIASVIFQKSLVSALVIVSAAEFYFQEWCWIGIWKFLGYICFSVGSSVSRAFTCFWLKGIQEPTCRSAAPLPDFRHKIKPRRTAYGGTQKNSLRNSLCNVSILWNCSLDFQNQNLHFPRRHWSSRGGSAGHAAAGSWRYRDRACGSCLWHGGRVGAADGRPVSGTIGCKPPLLSPTPQRMSVPCAHTSVAFRFLI